MFSDRYEREATPAARFLITNELKQLIRDCAPFHENPRPRFSARRGDNAYNPVAAS
jgi:hypothetical protein